MNRGIGNKRMCSKNAKTSLGPDTAMTRLTKSAVIHLVKLTMRVRGI
jgi:hypothetical protein